MNNKKLTKSLHDKKIAGVCGGIAEYFGFDSTVVRLVWAILMLAGGTGILPYILAAIIMPSRPAIEQQQNDYIDYTP